MDRQDRLNRFNLDKEAILEKFTKATEELCEDIELFTTINVDSKDNSLEAFITSYIEVLSDGFESRPPPESKSHFWNIITEVLRTKHIDNIKTLDEYPSDPARAYIWILIQLSEKKVKEDFEELSSNIQFLQYYSEKALIKSKKNKILTTLNKLTENDYKIDSKFLKVYKAEYSEKRRSSVWRPQNLPVRSTKSIVRQAENDMGNYNEILAKNHRKQTEDWDNGDVYVNPNAKSAYEDETKQNQFLKLGGDLLKLPGGIVSKTGDYMMKIPGTLLKIPGMGIFRKGSVRKGGGKRSLSGEKEKPTAGGDDEDEEEYNQNRNDRGITRTIKQAIDFVDIRDKFKPLNPMKLFERKKDFDDGETPGLMETEQPPEEEETDYGDTYGRFLEEEAKKGRLKNSKILFYEQYISKIKTFEYADPPSLVTSKPEEQEYKCYNCRKELSRILLLMKEKSFFCHYTGHWYCYDCMHKEKALIPWYVTTSFDFKQYHVSKESYSNLRKMFDKPILKIEYMDDIVQKNKILYDTLLMKRQVHLMYDMICDTVYMMDTFGKQSNLLLKENYFSLKQLRETKDGALLKFLEDKFSIIERHMKSCGMCAKKMRPCVICYKDPKVAVYDIKNTSICSKCKNLYHTKCLKVDGCSFCQHNA